MWMWLSCGNRSRVVSYLWIHIVQCRIFISIFILYFYSFVAQALVSFKKYIKKIKNTEFCVVPQYTMTYLQTNSFQNSEPDLFENAKKYHWFANSIKNHGTVQIWSTSFVSFYVIVYWGTTQNSVFFIFFFIMITLMQVIIFSLPLS
jgi:hypothetical protein